MNPPADHESHRRADSHSDTAPKIPQVPTWRSEELLGQSTEARIVHGGEVYRLLRTRNHKLILVK